MRDFIPQVYRLAVQFHMRQLEHLTIQYLEAAINHRNVLLAVQNADSLKLDFIKVVPMGLRMIACFCRLIHSIEISSATFTRRNVNFSRHLGSVSPSNERF